MVRGTVTGDLFTLVNTIETVVTAIPTLFGSFIAVHFAMESVPAAAT